MVVPEELKYSEEIQTIFDAVMKGYSKEEEAEFLSMCDTAGLTFEYLDNDIEKGVQNGYPVETQLGIIKTMFSQYF